MEVSWHHSCSGPGYFGRSELRRRECRKTCAHVELRRQLRVAESSDPIDANHDLVDAYATEKPLPFQPPWAVLPWNQPTPPRPVIKQIVRLPDITVTGRIFDLFV